MFAYHILVLHRMELRESSAQTTLKCVIAQTRKSIKSCCPRVSFCSSVRPTLPVFNLIYQPYKILILQHTKLTHHYIHNSPILAKNNWQDICNRLHLFFLLCFLMFDNYTNIKKILMHFQRTFKNNTLSA